MATPAHAALRQLALTALARRAGPGAHAEAIAAAADLAYDELVGILAPVIGDVGVTALTDRALHVAHHDYPWLLPTRSQKYTEATFSEAVSSLRQQDVAVATEAAAAVLAALLALLTTFIGPLLAERLMRQAWPDASSNTQTEET